MWQASRIATVVYTHKYGDRSRTKLDEALLSIYTNSKYEELGNSTKARIMMAHSFIGHDRGSRGRLIDYGWKCTRAVTQWCFYVIVCSSWIYRWRVIVRVMCDTLIRWYCKWKPTKWPTRLYSIPEATSVHLKLHKIGVGNFKITATTDRFLRFNGNPSGIADSSMPAPCLFFAHFLLPVQYVSSFGVEATARASPSRWRSSQDTVRCSSQASTIAAKS